MSQHSHNTVNQALIDFAAIIIIIAGLKAAAPIVNSMTMAIMVATICLPLVKWLKNHGVPLAGSLLLVAFTMSIMFLLLVILIGSSVTEFRAALPGYQASIATKFSGVTEWIGAQGIDVGGTPFTELINPGAAMGLVGKVFAALGAVLTNTFLIVITVIFILVEASDFPGKVRRAFGKHTQSLDSYNRFSDNLQRYLKIKTLVSVATGTIISLWLWINGLDFALLWGVVAFLFNYIPSIGSIIAAVPAVLLAIVQLGPGGAVLVTMGYVVVNVGMGNFIEPRLMGRGLGLSTLVVFLSLIFWGWILGPVGMLLSAPLTMMIKIALENDEGTRWVSILLGSAREDDRETDEDAPAPDSESQSVAG